MGGFVAFATVLMAVLWPVLARAASTSRMVNADGSEQRLWVADSSVPAGTTAVQTRVYYQVVPHDQWERPLQVASGVTSLTHRGSQPVALLTTGEWMFVDTRQTGPILPAGGRIIAMGSDDMTLYAVGEVAGGMASAVAATQPATTEPAVVTTGPATRAVMTTGPATRAAAATTTGPLKLVLFRLDRSTWTAMADLPEEIGPGRGALSLAVVSGRMYLAHVVAGAVVVHERTADGEWKEAGRLKPDGAEVLRAKVLDGGDRPIVWAAPLAGAGYFYFGGKEWSAPVEVVPQGKEADLSQPLPHDVAVVSQRLCLAFAKGEKLYVQPFDWRTGKAAGELVEVRALAAGGAADTRFNFWFNAVIMLVLIMVMLGTLRRRGEIEEAVRHLDEIPPAPLGLRFGAAIIDLWPLIGAYVFVLWRAGWDVDEISYSDGVVYYLVGMGIYVLHTMISELVLAATMGKLIFGLRVARLTGERPTLGALFVRNILRVIDVELFVGAVMIFLSPLRQRVGDLAGGTIVVRKDTPVRKPDDAEAAEKEESNA